MNADEGKELLHEELARLPVALRIHFALPRLRYRRLVLSEAPLEEVRRFARPWLRRRTGPP